MKVLILSHNPMSSKHSIGKTLRSLFSDFAPQQLCQLFVGGTPEGDSCCSYYRISDKAVLKGVLTRRVQGGQVQAVALGQSTPAATTSSAKNHLPHRELLRDMMWKLSPWYNKALRAWLAEQKPTCIFAAIGSNKFLYDMAMRIAQNLDIPLFTYVCDDFYTMKAPRTLLGPLWSRLLRRKTRALMQASRAVISICPEMSKAYTELFGVPAHTVMTGTNFSVVDAPRVTSSVKTLRYFGKVSLNRYRSLTDIGLALDAVNAANGTDYTLEIYCGTMQPHEEGCLRQAKSIRLCGFVSGADFEKAFFSSDALVHVEAFDSASIDRVRHSISTKIADSMASGIPMLAYGPHTVASIAHLVRNQSAFVATDAAALQSVLTDLVTNRQHRLETAQNGLRCASQYHNPKKASADIAQILHREGERTMKILQVNCVYNKGSTGRIVCDIHSFLQAQGHESFILYGRGAKTVDPYVYKTCGEAYAKANKLLCKLTGLMYGGCRLSTRRLISRIKKLQPDVVHLHCINGNFVNIYRLIQWLKKSGLPTVLTLHAEFMHTANCAYAYDCNKWKSGCGHCPLYRQKTGSLWFDRTAASWNKMRRAFDGFDNLTVVSVSPWLQQRAEQSPFFADKNHCVVLNGLDTSVFKRCDTVALRNELGLGNERVVFHATPNFNQNPDSIKGGRYVLELAQRLAGKNIRFVVAGPYPADLCVPDNVLLLGNISEKARLASLYAMADVTLLTSKAETFSMIVAESLACGTPMVGFCAGAPEQITLPAFSTFVPHGDIDALCTALLSWLEHSPDRELISAAAHQKYANQRMCEQYLSVYQQTLADDPQLGK